MGFVDFVEKLQNKPRQARVRIMWAGVTVSMFFIFIFWVWSLDLMIKKPLETAQREEGEFSKSWNQIKKDVPSLWESLGAGISNIMKEAQEIEKQTAGQAEETVGPPAQESVGPQEPAGSPAVGLPLE